jgi:5-methylthioadenosine/S-adenosylhomocysteine deaminase
MPFRRLRELGVPICLGSDEAVADDTANMWTVVKTAGLVHKITDPEYRNWPTAAELLDCLFAGGARAMRRSDRIGALAPGYEADIILVDLDSLNFTPLNDLRRQLVYCENGSSVRMTMVAGKVVARDGRLLSVDEQAIKREARELMREYARDIASAESAVRELYPFYRDMYLKAAAEDVGMNRWAGAALR